MHLRLVAAFTFASAGKAEASVPSIGYCDMAAIGFNYNLQEYRLGLGRHTGVVG